MAWCDGIRGLVKGSLRRVGVEVRRRHDGVTAPLARIPGDLRRVHYGCGTILLPGWLNVDLHPPPGRDDAPTLEVNLVRRHPFPDGAFRLGFSEDFLEHLDQGDQILFLAESYRTLEPGGILRLTFPELERVLAAHYAPCTYTTALEALDECYERHAHRCFPSRADLELMAHRVGFSEVRVLPGGASSHPDLCGLEFRGGEGATHISVELVKSSP